MTTLLGRDRDISCTTSHTADGLAAFFARKMMMMMMIVDL